MVAGLTKIQLGYLGNAEQTLLRVLFFPGEVPPSLREMGN